MCEAVGVNGEEPVPPVAEARTTGPAPELSIVMPVYNEQRALRAVLDEAIAALSLSPLRSEIVLVDDASTDKSLEILHDYDAATPSRCGSSVTKQIAASWGAFDTLYKAARGQHVFLNASDGQWKTAECLRFLQLRERYDIVVGYRRVKNYTFWRRVVSGAFNFFPRV